MCSVLGITPNAHLELAVAEMHLSSAATINAVLEVSAHHQLITPESKYIHDLICIIELSDEI